jgi:hypothetical protein
MKLQSSICAHVRFGSGLGLGRIGLQSGGPVAAEPKVRFSINLARKIHEVLTGMGQAADMM